MIYTFYSFKGGVGRSMALANIAELFYRLGLRVLMVDFDLEAPGLERYFDVSNAMNTSPAILSKRGVIDLLLSYQELRSLPSLNLPPEDLPKGNSTGETFHFPVEPLSNFCVPIYEKSANGGELILIPAGRRDGDEFTQYAERVQSFDWQDFYVSWDGEQFFDWFRHETEALADVVLIDSRTGITEMGGICTHHLADVVVMFVGSNQQNLDGTLKMAKSLSNSKLVEEGRKGRVLSLLPVPSRIENFEAQSLDEFAELFKYLLGGFVPLNLKFEDNMFTDLKIPYLPYYAYQERVAVRESERESAANLVQAFERVAFTMAKLAPETSRLYQQAELLLSAEKNQHRFLGGTHYHHLPTIQASSNNTNFFNVYSESPSIPQSAPQNIPRSGAIQFIGREQELIQLHEQLQQTNRIAIAAIVGIGGVGKTELALQYAQYYCQQGTYPGGVCWVQAQHLDIGSQIVSFGRSQLKLTPPEDLSLPEQVAFCWRYWLRGDVLLILDDVNHYEQIEPYLPPLEPRFKVLITSRLRLGRSVRQLAINVLDEDAALELLQSLVGEERIQWQQIDAKELCRWLGSLPLGLELVGRYLAHKPDLSLAEMRQRLEKKRLADRALTQPEADMTANEGIATAFESSWQELNNDAQHLCYLLSLFALAPIAWNWVESCFPARNSEDLEDLRDYQLIKFSLLQRLDGQTYILHQLSREFFRAKARDSPNLAEIDELKQLICCVMAKIAQTVPETPTLTDIAQLNPAIPHVKSVALDLIDFYSNEDLFWAFTGVARFYAGQGFYSQAEPWYVQCLQATTARLGQNHLDVATSLNNLARLYQAQGRYAEAEPLYVRSLAIREQQLGEFHPDVATSLNNLAELYQSQGCYAEAEPLYVRSLAIREQQLGEFHPDVAQSLNNLAELYQSQGCYGKAEPLYVRSLSIWEQQLGQHHPDVASSLNNLAVLYRSQGRYAEAEPLYVRSLAIREQQLGELHPAMAQSLNNLAGLYKSQGRCSEAEPLYVRSLAIREQQLGQHHPHVAQSLNNLAELYRSQGRYSEAEPLYVRSLSIWEQQLGQHHPAMASSLNNLAELYRSQERYTEAEPLYLRAITIFQQCFGSEHPYTTGALKDLINLLTQVAHEEQTETLSNDSLTMELLNQIRNQKKTKGRKKRENS